MAALFLLPMLDAPYIHVRHMNGVRQQPMDQFRNARMAMIDSQLRTSGVTEPRLLRAMAELPRELFVEANRQAVAYVDDLQPLGDAGRFMLSPAHFGRMAQLAKVKAEDKVLDLGAASGYSTAVLARLGSEVIGIELDPSLAVRAQDHLSRLGSTNAEIIAGDAASVAGQSFDVILVEGAVDERPEDLIAALRPHGRMVVPIVTRGVAVIHLFVKVSESVTITSEFDATIPRLRNWAQDEEFVF